MKKIAYKICCIAGLFGGLTTSCSDYLEVEPQNLTLFENFWQEEKDVENMMMGCYSSLQGQGAVERMIVWGEARSENMAAGTDISKNGSLQNIFDENIKATNGYTTWNDFYYVINSCNTIIKYAPGVREKDPGYSESELRAHIAEASAMRALCYFYLIRAFRNVPYSTEPYTQDDQKMDLPATSFDVILDNLIADLEDIKGDAIKKYPETTPKYQTGRITQMAINAMLCEMYLWKKEYDMCIHYADLVIEEKKQDAEDRKSQSGSTAQVTTDRYNGFPLLNSTYEDSNFGSYTVLFGGNGHSTESILELSFEKGNDNSPSNGAVNAFYGHAENETGFIKPSSFVGNDISTKAYAVFENPYDARFYENMIEDLTIRKMKYRAYTVLSVNGSGGYAWYTSAMYAKDKNKCNWIIYRLTDIMLLKAEALVQQMSDAASSEDGVTDGEATDEAIANADEALLQEAFTLVNAVNKRSVCQEILRDTLVHTKYQTKTKMEELVLAERQRELMFEGKRWFDLVRAAMRNGNTDVLVNNMKRKFSGNSTGVANKMSKMDAIFWPYNREELRVNPNLIQNPAYGSGDEGNYEKNN